MRKVFVLVLVSLIVMLTMPRIFTNVALATDMCDTNPSACQCSQATCNKACLIEELGLYTWQDAVGYGMEIGTCVKDCTTCVASEGADAEACSSCLQCVIENTATPASCLGACSGDPCSYGYECTPCSPWLPYTYRCSDHTREAKFCQCDGQGWYWSELACPSGKSCCISNGGVVCVDLQTDPNNCGSCGNACGANAYCSGGTCHCNEGYGNCDGDWSNGCEVNTNTDRNNCGSCGNACPADYPCCFDNDLADCTYSCASGNCLMSKTNIRPCPDGQHCEGGECKEVPEFPAGVTAVFGATLFIFLMMRRKYVRK